MALIEVACAGGTKIRGMTENLRAAQKMALNETTEIGRGSHFAETQDIKDVVGLFLR